MLAVPQCVFLMPEIFFCLSCLELKKNKKKVREKITDRSTHVPQNAFKKVRVVGVGDAVQVVFSPRYFPTESSYLGFHCTFFQNLPIS